MQPNGAKPAERKPKTQVVVTEFDDGSIMLGGTTVDRAVVLRLLGTAVAIAGQAEEPKEAPSPIVVAKSPLDSHWSQRRFPKR